MGALVGALRAMLTLDSTQFVSGANKAQKSGKKLETGLASLSGAMRKISIGVAVAAAGLGAAIKGQLNAADEMGKAAQKFGVGVEELSRLNYAAKLSDVSLETLGTSLRALSKNMVGAMKDGSAQAKMFADLGVNVTDAAGKMRSSEAVLQDVADVFAQMPDGVEKTTLAMKLFGKSGTEIIPMLNGGKAGLQEMAAEAERFGVVITEETAAAAEEFNDNITRMQAAFSGLVMKITAELAPVLAKISDWAVEAANGFQSLDPVIRGQLFDAFVTLGGAVAGAIELIGKMLRVAHEGFVILGGSVAGAIEIIANLATGIADGVGKAIKGVIVVWDAFVAKLQAAVQIAKDVAKAVAEALKVGGDGVARGPGSGGPTRADVAKGAGAGGGAGGAQGGQMMGAAIVNGAVIGGVEALKKRWGEFAAIASGITDIFKTEWQINSPSKVFQAIGQFLSEGLSIGITEGKPKVDTAMDELGDAIEGKADSFKSAFESMRSTLSSTFTGLVTGALSFKDALSQVIGKLAEMLAQSAFDGLMGAGGDGLLGGILKLFGFANGGAFQGGRVMAFASGGVVSGATAFAMQGGLGVMGEAGPEAIMPLARGRGGKLGVVAQGGGASRVQIEITENPMFASRVEGIADGRAVQIVRKYDREIAPQTRTRNPRERG